MTEGLHETVKVVALSATAAVSEACLASAKEVLVGAGESGATTTLMDLSTMKLPFYTHENDAAIDEHPQVQKLRAAVAEAQGVVLCTPVYHGSVSGMLRNALDLCRRDDFRGKMCGIVTISAEEATNYAHIELRNLIQSMRGFLISELELSDGGTEFTEEGAISSLEYRTSLSQLGSNVVQYGSLQHECESNLFLQTILD